ncbi:MAG: helix-turn-helix transcriptional regulator [Gammaproteobacteria bacterium]
MRLAEVSHYIGISKYTIKRLINAGEFVPIIKLGARAAGVFRADLDAWLRSRSETKPIAMSAD